MKDVSRPITALLALGEALAVIGLWLIATTPFGSERCLVGLAVSTLGLACLLSSLAARLILSRTGALVRRPRQSGSLLGRLGLSRIELIVLRFLVLAALLAAVTACIWTAGRDIIEVRALQSQGREVPATVISREPLPPLVPVGRAYYAYRAGSIAIEDSLPIPHSAYRQYYTGLPLTVTILPSYPHIHRLGAVTSAVLFRQTLFWLLVLLNALGFAGIPLLLIETGLRQMPVRRPLRFTGQLR